ncbi:MAG: hypothetical protein C0399_11275 [Syntrophus sp. (in: bacteria)]|nr:hypothetical protein [Syntrophus sp. (in: bacteria)]
MKYRKEITYSAVILLLFSFLVFLEISLPNFARFFPVQENKLLVVVLNINLLLILLLLFLITRIILKSYIEKKRGIWGSGLKKRLTSTLLFISIVPSFTLFILATGFFYVSMDRWFGQKIEDTLENALTLSQYHYEDIFQRYDKIANLMAREIARKNLVGNEAALKAYLKKNEKTYFLEYQSIHNLATKGIVTNNTKEDIEKQLAGKIKGVLHDSSIREIIPVGDGEMIIMGKQVLDESGTPEAVLFIGDKMKVQGTERIKQIASVSKEFKESRVIKKVLKYSFIVPLFLITILTIFVSLWVGIKMAAQITGPIEMIKEGAAIIAKGKFDINIEDRGKDEIGTLVTAFNGMARELQIAKDEIEEKRRYMEVILDNVATGIISTDKKGYILLLNRAAKTILGLEKDSWYGTPIREVFGDDFRMLTKSFLKDVRLAGRGSITKELRLTIKKNITYLRASLTALKDESNRVEGFIVAFDDITHIVRAEKLATWREVARKLTHEIKNPLTPIILSAERIRRKILSHFQGDEKEILDEATSIIIRSVDDIKGIVNELTKLTRISQAKTVEDLNAIVEEAMDLYKNLYQNIVFLIKLESIPPFRVDKDGLKRTLINLITNSVKAIDGHEGAISVHTKYEKARETVVIEFSDTGRGISQEDKEKIFDPYFTKDKDGTGLGLAIVHSIILEHHGKIHVEDNLPKGTKFVIELPVIEA